jgi:hypothetical protein
MKAAKKGRASRAEKFGDYLRVEQLVGLAAEMQSLRGHKPLTKRRDGKYEGDILGFVRGLRLSARVIYFLRERLSGQDLNVNWAHLLAPNDESCSPECDVVVHSKGEVRKWDGNDHPIMVFAFIEAGNARAIVSCKSKLTTIDKQYPKDLRKYGVKNIFLFAECCKESDFARLRKEAKRAGYAGLWCLYLTKGPTIKRDESMYVEFGNAVVEAVKKPKAKR